jgi:acetylornithine deacetylase/succinyl-diaminopimelate desuccinylase-like protein
MAGTAEFLITMHGKGGHAAMPHQTIDPVPAAAALITALQVRLASSMSAYIHLFGFWFFGFLEFLVFFHPEAGTLANSSLV